MVSPVVIYTNLFTLHGKDVKVNRYIDMYYVWLFYIMKYGKLNKDDYCITFMDEETYKYIKKSDIYKWIIAKLPNMNVITYETPTNIKDGMMKRYDIDEILDATLHVAHLNPTYLYLDIDVLVINDIRKLFFKNISNDKTTIYLKREGPILDNNYYGELITEEEKQDFINRGFGNMPGFTAGIFGWNKSLDFKLFIKLIKDLAKNNKRELYTVDQPFFNAAVVHYLFKEPQKVNLAIFPNILTGHNKFSKNVPTETVLLNFCGIPGDDLFHWDKILFELMLSSL